VVLLGDGEFDGTTLQETLNKAGWYYACRTAQSTVATWDGATFRLDTLGACSKPGTVIELKEVQITRDAYGPVMVLSCWAQGYQEPLYLVSNMETAEEACRYYQKRFGRIPQVGERWHSSGNALRFWSHSPCAPKEASSRCYA